MGQHIDRCFIRTILDLDLPAPTDGTLSPSCDINEGREARNDK